MRLIFLYGPPAVGKLTVAREIARQTDLPVFHNHLVVDAVGSVFALGDEDFSRLREQWWLDMFAAATDAGRSLIFTFQPEPSVAPDFPESVVAIVEGKGGTVEFVRLTADAETIEARLNSESRGEFGKLRSVELLRELRDSFAACEAAMPEPVIEVATDEVSPTEAARRIIAQLGLDA